MLESVNSQMVFEATLFLGTFLLSMFLTPFYTHFAYKYKWWKRKRTTDLSGKKLTVVAKLQKENTNRHFPTMAGLVGLVAVAGVTLVCNLWRSQTWLVLAGFVGGGVVGLIDDIINVAGMGRGLAGMRSSVKFILIAVIGAGLGWFFAVKMGWTSIYVPFYGPFELGVVGMIGLFAFAVVATGNAVNMSDGLDGLAGGLSMIAYGAFGIIALIQGQFMLAGFCLTVIGWLLSYVWFNVPPARFMMGDVGSFALGAGLGVVAMMTNCFLLLPVIGLVFVMETGSVILQNLSKKLRHGKKIWLATPIHHHFDAIGWGKAKIVMRFWVLAAVFACFGVFLALGGGMVG
jgi:phospho-N-acetylmuramoyl-pentapeptide-transferase